MQSLNVLVTGASSGIGLATVKHLAPNNKVYAAVRRPESATDLKVLAETSSNISIIQIDVDEDSSVSEGIAEVHSRAGRIDVLINNAGIGGSGVIEFKPISEAKQTFETDYWGPVRMIKGVLPGMREQRSGCIVNVSSMAGRVALGGHGHYCASKFALEGLSEILAQEVSAFNIRVAIIEPGVVLTSIFGKRRVRLTSIPEYDAITRRLSSLFEKQLRTPTMPETVAAIIEHAVTTDKPSLRYRVGHDAIVIMEGRSHVSDEEWVLTQSTGQDAEFRLGMKAILKEDLYSENP